MEVITLDEFLARLKAQNVPRRHLALKCPICSSVQSFNTLIAAGAGETEDDVEKYLGFSCFGRFTNAGPHEKDAPAGRGCDWTLGGLFRLHKLEVETPDGKRHMRFEVASPTEAQSLMLFDAPAIVAAIVA